jgi:hypothetical protein
MEQQSNLSFSKRKQTAFLWVQMPSSASYLSIVSVPTLQVQKLLSKRIDVHKWS